jgi:hypothetical protein
MINMQKFDCTLPIDCPNDQESHNDFLKLKKYTPVLKKMQWESRSVKIENKMDFIIPIDRTGLLSSNRYHYGARMACDSINSPSVIRSWYIQKFRKGLESSKFYEKSPKTALALRKYIPAQFRPSAAKTIFSIFNAKKIYDPCMGWGDRLSAALASNVELYYGRDVNPFVFSGYSEQVKNLKSKTNIHFEMKGCEIDCPEENYFDLTFTSPPYFKIEKYNGDMQSHALFKKINDWLNGFLFPTGKNCFNAVKDGGFIVFNISDVYCNHEYNAICYPLINYMKSIGSTYHGSIGYSLGKRINMNNKKSQTAGFCEPVLIFSKNSNVLIESILNSFVNNGQKELF